MATRNDHGARCHGDRGNAIVEFALTLPLLIVLLCGIIDFGSSFNDWISVRKGDREGLRQVLVDTHAPGGRSSWNCTTHFVESPQDVPADVMNMVCFTKNRVGLDDGDTRVKIFAPNGFVEGQPVKVCVQYKVSSLTRLFSSVLDGKVLQAESESLIEKTSPMMRSVEEEPVASDHHWADSCEAL